ncbi:MAG: hypothetical protein SF002_16330 [Alphaproteobacteria bacterium]|nr:hypothetical protein [Alphaproteobacteria bacterium]
MSTYPSTTAFSEDVFSPNRTNVTQLNASRSRALVAVHDHWSEKVDQRLNELVHLPVGWDGYAARPVAFSTANFAFRMLEQLKIPGCEVPHLVPGVNGDLQAEWHTESSSIELHVLAPNRVDAWYQGDDQVIEEVALTNNFIVVVGWLRALVRQDGAANSTAA